MALIAPERDPVHSVSQADVLWITIDSLRYDHTSMSGYYRDTTPRLQEIATERGGKSFSNCISHGIWTRPSAGSMLTGTYPMYHGLGFHNETLPAEVPTVAERFRESGFRTACISEITNVGPGTGLDRGFDEHRSLITESKVELTRQNPRAILDFALECVRHPAGFLRTVREDRKNFMRTAMPSYTRELTVDWLRGLDDDTPSFTYVHFLGPHVPYYPPPRYLDEYLDDVDMSPSSALEFSTELYVDLANIRRTIAHGCDFSEDEWAALHALFDAEVRHVDHHVGKLVDQVRRELDDVTVVITADHGDLLGEYGLITHRVVLDDALINVPLVVLDVPDLNLDDTSVVQHIDLMETLVDRSGGDTGQFQGVNLDEAERRYALAQRSEYDFGLYHDFHPEFDSTRFHTGRTHCVRDRSYKYLSSDGRRELFALPDEETDVSTDNTEVAERMDGWLSSQMDQYDAHIVAEPAEDPSEAMLQQLADLGYME